MKTFRKLECSHMWALDPMNRPEVEIEEYDLPNRGNGDKTWSHMLSSVSTGRDFEGKKYSFGVYIDATVTIWVLCVKCNESGSFTSNLADNAGLKTIDI